MHGWKTKDLIHWDDFRGKVAEAYGNDPSAFERMQFMKHFSEIR
jgi:hypothetical protein